jgi:S1-C subfamily serine protease
MKGCNFKRLRLPVQLGNSGGALVDRTGQRHRHRVGQAGCGGGAGGENYAVKSSLLLSFLESVPAVSAKLKAPNTADRKFEDVVKSAQDAAVLVLVY